jgi:TolB-like protein
MRADARATGVAAPDLATPPTRGRARRPHPPAWPLALAALGVLASVRPAPAQCPDGTPPPCGQAARGPSANSVAVLVFEDRARDSSLSLLAEGLADQITTNLAQVRRLDVRSSASVRTVLQRGTREPRRVGQALSARWLVDGAMLPGAARVRISVQLVEAATGRVRWSAAYQRPTDDLFGVIAAVSDSVAQAIVGELDPSERAALAARPTRSATAYDAYVRAEALARRNGFGNLRRAVVDYEEAIARDSTFAAAWAGLAWVWQYHDQFYPPRAVYPLARQAADRALALDSTLPAALIARSVAATWFEYDYTRGRALAERALAREPRNARAHLALAFAQMALGHVREAAGEARTAGGIDTLDAPLLGDVALVLLSAGHPEEAGDALRVAREASGDSLMYGFLATQILLVEGRCRPDAPGLDAFIGPACRLGPEAEHRIADSVAAATTSGDGPYFQAVWLADAYAAAGDREATLHWLERGLEERAFFGLNATRPLFAFVRDDPRFRALLRAAHIPAATGP